MMLAWDAFEKDRGTHGRSENGQESGCLTTMGVNVFTGDGKKSRGGSVRCVKFRCMNRDSRLRVRGRRCGDCLQLGCTPFVPSRV